MVQRTMKNKQQYKYPKWKRDWLNMSAGICMIFGFMTLIMIFSDYTANGINSCGAAYGAGAGIAFVLFAITFLLYIKAEEKK